MKVELTITAAMLAALFVQGTGAAHAVMLQGSVQQSARAATLSGASTNLAVSTSINERAARANILEGGWMCTTQVVSSKVRGILPGTQVKSMVQYRRDELGNMIASWFQNSWSPAASAVVKLDSSVMTARRESVADSANGWSARCQDFYKIVAPNKMVSESVVQQFANGAYIGNYKTQSVLTKAQS